jgi:hypothetical protein
MSEPGFVGFWDYLDFVGVGLEDIRGGENYEYFF